MEELGQLLEALSSAKNFVPVSQGVLTKCLGDRSKSIISMVQKARDFFGSFATVFLSVFGMVVEESKPETATPTTTSRLLTPEMTRFMQMYNDKGVQASLAALDNELLLAVASVVDKMCKSAMHPPWFSGTLF